MDLTLAQRKEYTNAVLCLMSKPALTSSAAPGAKSRFDDYIVVHVQQTPRNHGSVRVYTSNTYPVLISNPYADLLLTLAPLLRMALRASPSQRVWIQGISTGMWLSPFLSPLTLPIIDTQLSSIGTGIATTKTLPTPLSSTVLKAAWEATAPKPATMAS